MVKLQEPAIRIAVVCGSVRPNNNTAKAVGVLVDEMGRRPGVEVDLIDPAKLDLQFPGLGNGDADSVANLRKTIEAAAGVVLATPEYHGSFSSIMKLVIENLGFPSKLSGKPVSLLGVAAGSIGAIKSLEQLRCVCSHVGAIVLPGPVSVANVRMAFDAEGNCMDPVVEERVRGLAGSLLDFIRRHSCPRMALEAMVRSD
jgi:FMN reductase